MQKIALTLGLLVLGSAVAEASAPQAVSRLPAATDGGTVSPCKMCVLYRKPSIGEMVTLNPQPLPPGVMLNPQPLLPPGRVRMLSPQPLPPG